MSKRDECAAKMKQQIYDMNQEIDEEQAAKSRFCHVENA